MSETPYKVEYGPLSAGDYGWFMHDNEPRREEIFAVEIEIHKPPCERLVRVHYTFKIWHPAKPGSMDGGKTEQFSLASFRVFPTKDALLDSMRDTPPEAHHEQ